MWGLNSRTSRLGAGGRNERLATIGLTRLRIRGPVEHGVLEVAGELDFTCAEEVLDVAQKTDHRIAAMDLSQLEFVDSRGIRALQTMQSRFAERNNGAAPDLVGVRPEIRRTFEVVDQATRGRVPVA